MPSSAAETSVRAVTVMIYTRYEYRKVYARVHLLGETHLAPGGKVELVLYSTRSGETRETKDVEAVGCDEVAFDTGEIPSGCCDFKATFVDRFGTRFATRTLQDKWPGDLPWLGSREGITRRVPGPWTPLNATETGDGLESPAGAERTPFRQPPLRRRRRLPAAGCLPAL